MATYIIDFDPSIHQKVRYNEQLYVVMLKDFYFFRLPTHADVVIHLFNHNKIIFHGEKEIQLLYTVKKRELIIVASHVEE